MIKVFSVGMAILKELRRVGLLKVYVSVNECLGKRDLDVGHARKKVYNGNEWWRLMI